MSITTVEAVAGPVGAEADPAGVGAVAGPEVRPARQVYSAAYKLKVLAELDAADSKSARGEIVRREGLYSSLVPECVSSVTVVRSRRWARGPHRRVHPPDRRGL